jgi:xanthine dehydrogenase accessory factor
MESGSLPTLSGGELKEIRQIVKMWQNSGGSVLATLVRTKGSSYRRAGARLLLSDQNHYAGTISGGCLETEVVRKAAWLIRQGAVVERYSTEFDDTAEIPFGLGCGGVVDLLLEPTDTPEFRALIAALQGAVVGDEAVVLTWLPHDGSELARVVLTPKGDFLFASENLTESTLVHVRAIVMHGLEALPEEIFMERLVAPQRIFILGAGDDAKPLVSMGALLGWTMNVLDGRAQLARPERFPEAERVEASLFPSSDLQSIKRNDAVVLMTHSYEQDRELLAAVLPLGPAYLGLLGARHRTCLLISEVAKRLGWSTEECCAHIHAPVGLDLGGDGPEVIALAVIAEVQAVRTGKPGSSRKLSAQDVESFTQDGGPAQYVQAHCALDTQ